MVSYFTGAYVSHGQWVEIKELNNKVSRASLPELMDNVDERVTIKVTFVQTDLRLTTMKTSKFTLID